MKHSTENFDKVKIKIDNITQLKEVIKMGWRYNRILRYSTNKNCQDKEVASMNEDLFMTAAVSFNKIATIVKATTSGYYLDIDFACASSSGLLNKRVCLYLSDEYCDAYYATSLDYKVIDSFLRACATKNILLKPFEVSLATNIEWIESTINDNHSNTLLHLCDLCSEYNLITELITAAKNKKLINLGIDNELFWNASGKNTCAVYHKGVNYALAALKDGKRQTFDVKYNISFADALLESNNADNILIYNNGYLSRYMKVKHKSYILYGPAIQFNIDDYTSIKDKLPITWDEFWERVN